MFAASRRLIGTTAGAAATQQMLAAIAETPECKRWWAHMVDVMPSNPDNSPVAAPLREVFHLD